MAPISRHANYRAIDRRRGSDRESILAWREVHDSIAPRREVGRGRYGLPSRAIGQERLQLDGSAAECGDGTRGILAASQRECRRRGGNVQE
jgi:hypothetical protein